MSLSNSQKGQCKTFGSAWSAYKQWTFHCAPSGKRGNSEAKTRNFWLVLASFAALWTTFWANANHRTLASNHRTLADKEWTVGDKQWTVDFCKLLIFLMKNDLSTS
jgi:hypothetical protein